MTALAESQGGHVNRAQLRALGVSTRQVEYWNAKGFLIPVYRNVYAVARRSGNPIDRCHAALLAVGERCALAGWTAARVWGLKGAWTSPLEVITPLNRRIAGLTIHQSRCLLTRDITTAHGLTVVSAAVTVLHIARDLSDTRLERAIDDLRFAEHLRLEHLPDVLARFPRHPGTRPLCRVLDIAQPEPTRSAWEQDWPAFAAAYGLPEYVMNTPLKQCPDIRPDILFPRHRLIVELDGKKGHDTPWAIARDREHDARVLRELGIRTLRFTHQQLTETPDEVAAEILRCLG